VARGEERTAAAGAEVTWLQADMATLPFADATFDRVLSGLAPMFCLRARDGIAELFRVVRPGGTVAFTVGTQSGVVGRLLRLAATHDPPPAGVPTRGRGGARSGWEWSSSSTRPPRGPTWPR